MTNDHDSDRRHDDTRTQRVTQRAFARFEARGCLHGSDVEDWLEAEREEAEAERESLVATPPPGLVPRVSSGDSTRDEATRREAERSARDMNRDAQRQLAR